MGLAKKSDQAVAKLSAATAREHKCCSEIHELVGKQWKFLCDGRVYCMNVRQGLSGKLSLQQAHGRFFGDMFNADYEAKET